MMKPISDDDHGGGLAAAAFFAAERGGESNWGVLGDERYGYLLHIST